MDLVTYHKISVARTRTRNTHAHIYTHIQASTLSTKRHRWSVIWDIISDSFTGCETVDKATWSHSGDLSYSNLNGRPAVHIRKVVWIYVCVRLCVCVCTQDHAKKRMTVKVVQKNTGSCIFVNDEK